MWSVWISCSARKFLFIQVLLLWSINTDTVTATQPSWIQVKECAASNYIPSSWHSLFFPSLSFLCLTLSYFFYPLVTNIKNKEERREEERKRGIAILTCCELIFLLFSLFLFPSFLSLFISLPSLFQTLSEPFEYNF